MKKTLVLMAACLTMAGNLYAGDLIVNGNVGIGTTSPGATLDVNGIAKTQQRIQVLGNTSPTTGAGLELGYDQSAGSGVVLSYDRSGSAYKALRLSASDLRFENSGTEYMRLTGGNVGVGTINPSQKLDVNGNIALGGGYSANANIITGGTSSSDSSFLQLFGKDYWDSTRKGEFTAVSYGNGDIRFYNQPSPNQWSELMRITKNGKVGIGTPNPLGYSLYVNGPAYTPAGVWAPSDIKYKKDIKQIDSALDKVNNLTGVSYLYKTDEYKDKNFPEGTQLGVIAQELEKVIPEAVMTDDEGTKAVNYSEIIPVLIEAIKSQQKEIEELKSKVK